MDRLINEYGRKLILLEQKVSALEGQSGQQQAQPSTSAEINIKTEPMEIINRVKSEPTEKSRKRVIKGI